MCMQEKKNTSTLEFMMDFYENDEEISPELAQVRLDRSVKLRLTNKIASDDDAKYYIPDSITESDRWIAEEMNRLERVRASLQASTTDNAAVGMNDHQM